MSHTLDLSDPQEWLLQYNSNLNTLRTIIDETQERLSTKKRSKLRKSILSTKTDIKDLRDNISSLKVTPADKKSRKGKCDELSDLVTQVESNISSNGAHKRKLLEEREKRYRDWQPGDEPEETREMDNRQILAYQNKVMGDQDKSAEKLSNALSRVKKLGTDIGDELDEHSKLLDDLNTDTNKTKKNIERQNKKIDKLMKQARIPLSLCCIICLIIILAIVLVIILRFVVFKK